MSYITQTGGVLKIINNGTKIRLYAISTFIASLLLFGVAFSDISGSPEVIFWLAVFCVVGSGVILLAHSSSESVFHNDGAIELHTKTVFKSFDRTLRRKDVEYIELKTAAGAQSVTTDDVVSAASGTRIKNKKDQSYTFDMSLRTKEGENLSVASVHVPLKAFPGPGTYTKIPKDIDENLSKVFSVINAPIRVRYDGRLSGPIPDQVRSQVSGVCAHKGPIKVERGAGDQLALKTNYLYRNSVFAIMAYILAFVIATILAGMGYAGMAYLFEDNVFLQYLTLSVVLGISLWAFILLFRAMLPKKRIRVTVDTSRGYIKKQNLTDETADYRVVIDTISSLNVWRTWKKDMGGANRMGTADSLFHYYTIQTRHGNEFLVAYIQIYKCIIGGVPIIPAGKDDDEIDPAISQLADFLNVSINVKN